VAAAVTVMVALVVSEGVERKALHSCAAGHTSSQEDTQSHRALRCAQYAAEARGRRAHPLSLLVSSARSCLRRETRAATAFLQWSD
jgi:hypothetical protein